MRAAGLAVAALFALGALVLGVLHWFPAFHSLHAVTIAAASFIPYWWVPVLVASVVFVLCLRRWWRLVGVAGLAWVLLWAAIPHVPGGQPIHRMVKLDPGIGALAINVEYGGADLDGIAQHVRDDTALLVLLEVTPEFEERLDASRLAEDFPHRLGTVRTDAGGTLVLSRTPLSPVHDFGTVFDSFVVATTVGGREWYIGAVHAAPPHYGGALWEAEGRLIADYVQGRPHERFLLLGDFNATPDHLTMRLIRDAGGRFARDDHEAFGVGSTWPTNSWMPPFARIDHCVDAGNTRFGCVVSHFTVDGTDHKGLHATGYVMGE